MSRVVRIAVIGNDLAGAMATALLATELPQGEFRLMNVPARSRDNPAFNSVAALDPSMRRFHARLGLTDSMLVQAGASFNLGVGYAGWSSYRPAYFSPFGDIGATIAGVAFHQHIARLREQGGNARIGDFSIATLLAQSGRFCRPADNPASPLSTFSYGMHIEQTNYVESLFEIARRHGAELLDRSLAQVDLHQTGDIQALLLDDGGRQLVDFVVDASGMAISAIEPGWESWRSLFRCDRMAHSVRRDSTPPAPYSLIDAQAEGWLRTVPCQTLVADTLVYSSDSLDQAGAEKIVSSRTGATTPVIHSDFQAGRHLAPWSRNCVAIGTAASMLEPLHPIGSLLLLNSLDRLLRLFPSGSSNHVEMREFNRETIDELDRARDLVLLRYLLNDRTEPFWVGARHVDPPPELQQKMIGYRSRGMVPMIDGDLFEEADWALIFDEHGVRPERYSLLTDTIPLKHLVKLLESMRGLFSKTVAAQPRHEDYLSRLRQKAAA